MREDYIVYYVIDLLTGLNSGCEIEAVHLRAIVPLVNRIENTIFIDQTEHANLRISDFGLSGSEGRRSTLTLILVLFQSIDRAIWLLRLLLEIACAATTHNIICISIFSLA